MKKILLFASIFASFSTFAQSSNDCKELFISEYVEGIGNNKAIEIYNPTDGPINLQGYVLMRMNNGSTDVKPFGTVQSNVHQLPNFVLDAKKTFVIVLDRHAGNATNSDPATWTELREMADMLMSSSYEENNTMNFNGNDAMLLGKGDATNKNSITYIDIFGRIGEDPHTTGDASRNGWSSVFPYNNTAFTDGNLNDRPVTVNHTLTRKANVKRGISNQVLAGTTPFNPLLQWDSFPPQLPKRDAEGNIIYQTNNPTVPQWVGNWGTLGWHYCACNPLSNDEITTEEAQVIVYPNPSSGVFNLMNVVEVKSFEVRNALGQLVTSEKNEGKNVHTLEIAQKTGVYFLTMTYNSGKTITQKLVVQ